MKTFNSLKRTSKEDNSSLVLSFDQKWQRLLLDSEVEVVFRKKGPTPRKLGFIYVYIGSPISALIGRVPVKSYTKMDTSAALKLADKGKIELAELRAYASNAFS